MSVVSALRAVALGALVFAAGCTLLDDPSAQFVSGVVEDTSGRPLPGARVRLQGTTSAVSSGEAGEFRFAAPPAMDAGHITAWKDGYYIGGVPLASGGAGYRIRLKPLPAGDNAEYRWVSALRPADGRAPEASARPCETCHLKDAFPLVRDWEASAHGRAATNPFFLAFYNGGSRDVPLLPALGYKRDFPRASGNCANCHVPALALRRPYDADPNRAAGVEREGVLCDLCHKVRQVEVDTAGGRPGVLSMTFLRPPPGEQLFNGPFEDVFPGPDTFHALYKESRYCASCHHGVLWGVLAYGEFAEWQASAYAERGVHCQNCHMKPDGRTQQVAVASEGAIRRRPGTISSHAFAGRDDAALMGSGLEVETQARFEDGSDRLRVRVKLRNTGAGHHIPTGSPMRNLLLLVEARDNDGNLLELIRGGRIPVWGGTGPEELGNYAGVPGKGYAKILSTPMAYPADPRPGDGRAPIYPAPHWRPIVVESDNRIPAGGEDATEYVFRASPVMKDAEVRIRVVNRRTFRSWLDPQAKPEGDLVVAERKRSLRRQERSADRKREKAGRQT